MKKKTNQKFASGSFCPKVIIPLMSRAVPVRAVILLLMLSKKFFNAGGVTARALIHAVRVG